MIRIERLLPGSRSTPSHRFQVYRQARNGVHNNYGGDMDSPAEAVAHFLHTAPMFEGGGLHLWDYHEQRAVASAEWAVEKTRFGFWVRTRTNVFHDESLTAIARQITERETIERTITGTLRANA